MLFLERLKVQAVKSREKSAVLALDLVLSMARDSRDPDKAVNGEW